MYTPLIHANCLCTIYDSKRMFSPETLKIRLDPSPLKNHVKNLICLYSCIKSKSWIFTVFFLKQDSKKRVQHVSFSHLICSSNLIHTQYLKVEKKSPLRLHCEHRHYNVTMSWWNSLTLVLNCWEVHGIHSHMSNLGIQSTLSSMVQYHIVLVTK